jgi:hypothetical protein
MSEFRDQPLASRPKAPAAPFSSAPRRMENTRVTMGLVSWRPASRANGGQIFRAAVLIGCGLAVAALPRLSHADILHRAVIALAAPAAH